MITAIVIHDPTMNRRMFLQSALALGAVGSVPARSRAAQDGANSRLKIGLLGGGHSHGLAKAKVLQESPDWELVGLCEENPDVGQRYAAAGVHLVSQEELLASCAIIAVESENRDHARHAKLALQAGKHVHVEKPPSAALTEFRELQSLAREKGLLMQMGYMWRYHPGINACLEAARRGWLGEVYLVRGTIDTNAGPAQRKDWAQFSGGVFFELGCHLLDPLVRLLGAPRRITPVLQQTRNDGFVDNAVVTFEFERALGVISSAATQPGAQAHRQFEVLGTNGHTLIKPIEPPTLEIDLTKAAGPYHAGKQIVPLPAYRRYAPELADFADAIRTKRTLAVTSEEDLRVHEALLRACSS
ncbi:MAG: Gfo/Idh/MocA family oxidoreductase [Verrucomicrobiales bacterium]|nr:Gfo/Idh/MocA family oxidoreductase [Verrucomicrobiales bacterium]